MTKSGTKGDAHGIPVLIRVLVYPDTVCHDRVVNVHVLPYGVQRGCAAIRLFVHPLIGDRVCERDTWIWTGCVLVRAPSEKQIPVGAFWCGVCAFRWLVFGIIGDCVGCYGVPVRVCAVRTTVRVIGNCVCA